MNDYMPLVAVLLFCAAIFWKTHSLMKKPRQKQETINLIKSLNLFNERIPLHSSRVNYRQLENQYQMIKGDIVVDVYKQGTMSAEDMKDVLFTEELFETFPVVVNGLKVTYKGQEIYSHGY